MEYYRKYNDWLNYFNHYKKVADSGLLVLSSLFLHIGTKLLTKCNINFNVSVIVSTLVACSIVNKTYTNRHQLFLNKPMVAAYLGCLNNDVSDYDDPPGMQQGLCYRYPFLQPILSQRLGFVGSIMMALGVNYYIIKTY